MVIDTSVIVALVLIEPGFELYEAVLLRSDDIIVPTPMVLESFLVLSGRTHTDAGEAIQLTLDRLGAREMPFKPVHRLAAQAAFERFGKGRHPARLNFGDCMSYAVAKVEGRPLLFVGEDFAKTDVVSAIHGT